VRQLLWLVAACLLALVVFVACRRDSRQGESCSSTADCVGELRCVAQVCACQCDGGVSCDASGNCLSKQAFTSPSSASVTWTDPATGLVWMNSVLDTPKTWQEALSYCTYAVVSGFDDWRLPTISELRSLIRGCAGTSVGGACAVSDSRYPDIAPSTPL